MVRGGCPPESPTGALAQQASSRALQDVAAQQINLSQPCALREYLYPGGNKSNVA